MVEIFRGVYGPPFQPIKIMTEEGWSGEVEMRLTVKHGRVVSVQTTKDPAIRVAPDAVKT